jgi:CheY-like chemotaxis protein
MSARGRGRGPELYDITGPTSFTPLAFILFRAMTKILVIENHADMREILVRILDLMGFTAITSKNGREGVEKALAEKPDLIVMDIMMPEISGWEATRILRSNPETKDVPVLAATVLFRPTDLQRCINVGCNDYIVKPFTVKQLRRKIERLI